MPHRWSALQTLGVVVHQLERGAARAAEARAEEARAEARAAEAEAEVEAGPVAAAATVGSISIAAASGYSARTSELLREIVRGEVSPAHQLTPTPTSP